MSQTHLPPQWRQRLLAILNSQGWNTGVFAGEPLRLLAAWAQAEGGTAAWNPLNTTAHVSQNGVAWQGADYNNVRVANYLKPTYGVMATVATLLNGNYNGIVGFLQAPAVTAEECVVAHQGEFRTWGTNPDTILAVLKTL